MTSRYGTGLWWDTLEPKTPAESFRLTKEVFVEAERDWPDLMEPWSTRVAESIDLIEQQKIMREGLGATFKERRQPVKYPTLRYLLEAA